MGSNDHRLYGPDYLVDQGVVLVAINYRLGPLGFFSLGNDQAPGNQVNKLSMTRFVCKSTFQSIMLFE